MKYRNIILISALIFSLPNFCMASNNKSQNIPNQEKFTSISTCLEKDGHYFICGYIPNAVSRVNTSQCINISKEIYVFMKKTTEISKSSKMDWMPGTGSPGGDR